MPVRVLIVDDSSFFRKRVTEMLEADKRFKVVGSAIDGNQAIQLTKSVKPDVITMDIEMPVMDGITAVEKIMACKPTPILMFSSLTRIGAQATLDALQAGALDYLPKNFEDISRNQEEVARVLRARVWSLSKCDTAKQHSSSIVLAKKHVAAGGAVNVDNSVGFNKKSLSSVTRIHNLELIAIGSSTGGPVALQEILEKLPASFSAPILLIQHMPATFTTAFADRMNRQCQIQVREAKDGDLLKPGVALLAPGGMQVSVLGQAGKLRVQISEGSENISYKPCVDLAFKSIASAISKKCLAIILTGMGSDGREGARQLKTKNAEIWVQDEASSVIYGMPMAVKKAGLADRELSLEQIAQALIKVI